MSEPRFPPGTAEVVIDERYGGTYRTRLAPVLKQTRTQIVIAGSRPGEVRRFDSESGDERGLGRPGRHSIGEHSTIRPATPEWRDRARRYAAVRTIVEACHSLEKLRDAERQQDISTEKLETVASLLEQAQAHAAHHQEPTK